MCSTASDTVCCSDFTEAVVPYSEDDDARASASVGDFLDHRDDCNDWCKLIPDDSRELQASETRLLPCIAMLNIPAQSVASRT